MDTIDNLIESLPKKDIATAKMLLKKKDIEMLGYLAWADYSRVKRSPEEFPGINVNNLHSLSVEIDKLLK